MSYDVSIGKFDGNYTSNQWKLFHVHVQRKLDDGHEPFTGLQCLHDLTGREAQPILTAAFDSLVAERRIAGNGTLGHYDAPNGWGTAMGAVLFLAQIMAACMNYPDEKIYVSA